jgi:hypothetical protein
VVLPGNDDEISKSAIVEHRYSYSKVTFVSWCEGPMICVIAEDAGFELTSHHCGALKTGASFGNTAVF